MLFLRTLFFMDDLLCSNIVVVVVVGRMFMENNNYNTDSNNEKDPFTKDSPNMKRNWVTIHSVTQICKYSLTKTCFIKRYLFFPRVYIYRPNFGIVKRHSSV